jgi:uncharacterized protein (DUF1778 family)
MSKLSAMKAPVVDQEKRERITARVNENVHGKLSEAAELTGATLSQFLVAAAIKEAERVIEHERIVRLDIENARAFLSALEQAPEPTEGLVNLFRHA